VKCEDCGYELEVYSESFMIYCSCGKVLKYGTYLDNVNLIKKID